MLDRIKSAPMSLRVFVASLVGLLVPCASNAQGTGTTFGVDWAALALAAANSIQAIAVSMLPTLLSLFAFFIGIMIIRVLVLKFAHPH